MQMCLTGSRTKFASASILFRHVDIFVFTKHWCFRFQCSWRPRSFYKESKCLNREDVKNGSQPPPNFLMWFWQMLSPHCCNPPSQFSGSCSALFSSWFCLYSGSRGLECSYHINFMVWFEHRLNRIMFVMFHHNMIFLFIFQNVDGCLILLFLYGR